MTETSETLPAISPVTVALTVLVENAGNISKTQKLLETAGFKCTEADIREWRDETHHQEFQQITRRFAREIEERVVSTARQNAFAAAEAEAKAIAKASEQLDRPHISAKEAASAASDLAKVKSANIDKMLTLTGRPAVITESRDIIAIVKSLEKDGVLKVSGTLDE